MGPKPARWFAVCLALLIFFCATPSSAQQVKLDEQSPENIYRVRVSITPARRTVLASQMAGRIELLDKRDGDRFKQGRVLVRMDCSLAESRLAKAKVVYGKQQKIYEITSKLYKLKSRSALELAVAEAEAQEARAQVRLEQALVNRCYIKAPFDGRVTELQAREKQYVTEGEPILEIMDDDQLELEFIAPSTWVRWLKPGFVFKVAIVETGKEYDAKIDRFGGKVDPVSQSIKVYGKVCQKHSELMPGMSGLADLVPPRDLGHVR